MPDWSGAAVEQASHRLRAERRRRLGKIGLTGSWASGSSGCQPFLPFPSRVERNRALARFVRASEDRRPRSPPEANACAEERWNTLSPGRPGFCARKMVQRRCAGFTFIRPGLLLPRCASATIVLAESEHRQSWHPPCAGSCLSRRSAGHRTRRHFLGPGVGLAACI